MIKNYDEQLLQKSIQKSQIKEFISKLPQGIDTHVGEKGVKISGGQLQRIGIARAIYKNSEILIFGRVYKLLRSKS